MKIINKNKEPEIIENNQKFDASIEKLVPFENHPFKVNDDEEMKQLMESIEAYGVLTPIVVTQLDLRATNYEVVSGHRRLQACKNLGLTTIPAVYIAMTYEEAVIAMVDSNLQREHILPSEKAKAYQLKMEAMKKTASRPSKNSCQVGTNSRTDEEIAENATDSARQIQRYIRLNNLIPELLQMVDEERIALTPAVELSYLTEEEQRDLLETIDSEETTPSLSQAQQMKRLSQAQMLDMDQIFSIMVKPKANQKVSLKIPVESVQKYVPGASEKQLVEHIMKALDYYNKALQRQRNRSRDER